jgi:hypothetical protein
MNRNINKSETNSGIILYSLPKQKLVKVKGKNAVDGIYYQDLRFPYQKDLKNDNLSSNIKNIDEYHKSIKSYLSNVIEEIPLFDVYNQNIFLINKFDVYNRVVNNNLRPLDEELKNKIKKLNQKLKQKFSKEPNNILLKEKLKKTNLMLDFFQYYDLVQYEKTFFFVFYYYSFNIGRNITNCIRPSFSNSLPHISPFYTKTELLSLALNLNLKTNLKNNINEINNLNVEELCKKISDKDINYSIILNHQKHIINQGGKGLLQYYTLQGSFFINQYLRGLGNYNSKNSTLEVLINNMKDLINTAPEFDNNYILYRFVFSDEFFTDLNEGDIFQDPGFLSTTRNPFYQSDVNQFGTILIKIHIPQGKKGVALCLEGVSHFPKENEVIFSPYSKFRLRSKSENITYYHIDSKITNKIKKKYELEWVSNVKKLKISKEPEEKLNKVNFLKKNFSTHSLDETIRIFIKENLDPSFRFIHKIGNRDFVINAEWFDSTSVYKDYYAIKSKNGFNLYSLYKGYILFSIEIGNNNNKIEMHVNYQVKYNEILPEKLYSSEDFIEFISKIGYYFKVNQTFYYAQYNKCNISLDNYSGNKKIRSFEFKEGFYGTNNNLDNTQNIEYLINDEGPEFFQGSYCLDLVNYLYNKKERFHHIAEIKPIFSYKKLDFLKDISPVKILFREDQDEIYQIYQNIYSKQNHNDNLWDFLKWLFSNFCYLFEILVKKLNRIFGNDNPFILPYYTVDYLAFLYRRGLIISYTSHSLDNSVDLGNRKNLYRIEF